MSVKVISEDDAKQQKVKQIKDWVGSLTDRCSEEYHVPSKVKFTLDVALMSACYAGDEKEFERILNLGVDIDVQNPDGISCVHHCCISSDQHFLEFLIKHGANINLQDNEGWSPLHAAASVGSLEMVDLLIEHGSDLTLLTCEMELAVDLSSSLRVIDRLNAAMDMRGIDPSEARHREEIAMQKDAQRWLDSGVYSPVIDPRSGATPLHVTACKNYTEVMATLLQIPDVDVDARDNDGWTALHAAAHWNRENVARLLSQAGASFDATTFTNQSLFDIADRQMMPILRQLRDRQRAERPLRAKLAEPAKVLPETAKRSYPAPLASSDSDLAGTNGRISDAKVPPVSVTAIPAAAASAALEPESTLPDQQQLKKAKPSRASPPSSLGIAETALNGRAPGQSDSRSLSPASPIDGHPIRRKSPSPAPVVGDNMTIETLLEARRRRRTAATSQATTATSEVTAGLSTVASDSPTASVSGDASTNRINVSYTRPRSRRILDTSILPTNSAPIAAEPKQITLKKNTMSDLPGQHEAANISAGDDTAEDINRRFSVLLAPTKSSEAETERSVRARKVRSTRRSTQGVCVEALDEALRIKDQNNNAAAAAASQPQATAPASSRAPSYRSKLREELPVSQAATPPSPTNRRSLSPVKSSSTKFSASTESSGVIPRPSSHVLRDIDSNPASPNKPRDSPVKTSNHFVRLRPAIGGDTSTSSGETGTNYRLMYEQEKSKRENLESELDELKREYASLRIQVRRLQDDAVGDSKVSGIDNSSELKSSVVANARRKFPSSLSSTTEDLSKELARLKEENAEVKEENAKVKEDNSALIRVISKLSRNN